MRKNTIICAVAVLLLAAVPCHAQQALLRAVDLTMRTLDHTPLQHAVLYAVDNDYDLFYLQGQGSALPGSRMVESVADSIPLEVAADGYGVTGTVDAAVSYAFVVMKDRAGRSYVLAAARPDADGLFSAARLFAAGDLRGVVTADATMLRGAGADPFVARDDDGYVYSTLRRAVEGCREDGEVTLLADATLDTTLVIGKSLTVRQADHAVSAVFADATAPAVRIAPAGQVTWNGGASHPVLSAPGTLFSVRGDLALKQMNLTSSRNALYVGGEGRLSVDSCDIATLSSSASAVLLADDAVALVGDVTFGPCDRGIHLANDGATLLIYDATVRDGMADVTSPVGADAYMRAMGFRYYRNTLATLVGDAAADDTLYLARSLHGVTTLDAALCLDLAGYTIDTLAVATSDGVLTLLGGDVQRLTAAGHATLAGGRYQQVVVNAGAMLTIVEGKLSQTGLDDYVAEGSHLIANVDADGATYPYAVKEGFLVRFRNYNSFGNRHGDGSWNDSVAVYGRATDYHIFPSVVPPAYVGADKSFTGYYVDSAYVTPWQDAYDRLTADTVLYGAWADYSASSDYRYSVAHHLERLDGSYSLLFTEQKVAPQDATVKVPVRTYVGYHEHNGLGSSDSVEVVISAEGQQVDLQYDLSTYVLKWDFNGGENPLGADSTQLYRYSDTIVYPDSIYMEGHTRSWSDEPVTMPAANIMITALYTPRLYSLTWVGADTTVVYSAAVPTAVAATFVDDHDAVRHADLTYTDPSTGAVSDGVKRGVYTVSAVSPDSRYTLSGLLATTLTVVADTVEVVGAAVESAKLLDGSDSAVVTYAGAPDHVLGQDDVTVVTTATYAQAAAGTGIAITAHYTLSGADAANYVLRRSDEVVATDGEIVTPIVVDVDAASADSGIVVSPQGYCGGENGEAAFLLTAASNSADQYRLFFGAEAHAAGFADVVTPQPLTSAGGFSIAIPLDAPMGTYSAYLRLSNSLYNVGGLPRFESDSVAVHVVVNLPSYYTQPLFADVITIVDTCHCIDHSSVVWYHNGVRVGTGPYYQEPGGVLTGTYHATMDVDGVATRTCEQDDVTTLIADEEQQPKLTVYPNPASDRVRVSLANGAQQRHVVKVMNIMGRVVYSATFDGGEWTIDLADLAAGSYTVTVDGITKRLLKD